MRRFIFCIIIFISLSSLGQKVKLPAKAYKPGLKVGTVAPNFVSLTYEGKPVTLSEMLKKNKITLIEFWASWCVPCRYEIPNLKKIYSAFHDKGFEIIGVSLDFSAVAWKNIIKKDSIPWINVSELSGRDETAAKIYYVNALPAAVLIDSTGKILMLDLPGSPIQSDEGSLRGKSLFEIVEKVLKKSI